MVLLIRLVRGHTEQPLEDRSRNDATLKSHELFTSDEMLHNALVP